MPSRDSIVIAHPVGPHLTVEFQTPDGVDLAIFGFKYIIYNGQPAWESLIKSSEAASFLSTDQTAAILRKEVDLLAGTKSQDEQCTLDIEYLTATKKLVTVKDSVQHIRGSLILEDSETKQLWNVLEPNEKLELPGLTGTGVHIAPLSLSRAHEAGLIGRFPSDREKEITGKEIISERLTIYLLEFPVDGFTQTYWRDNKNGATLVVSTDGIIQSIDFSLRDLFGVIADDSVVARVDGQLYRFIRGMDPRYAEAVKFLLASFGATQVAMDISPDLLHYLLEEGWIAVVPQNGRYQMTTRGLMETLKHRPA